MFKKIYKSMRFVTLIALVISAIMVFSACYYVFNLRIEKEIKANADTVAAFLNQELQSNAFSNSDIPSLSDDKSLVILSQNGDYLYLQDDNHLFSKDTKSLFSRPEVKKAIANGYGESEAYSTAPLSKIYSYARSLSDGSILIVACDTLDMMSLMIELMIVLLFMCVLIFVFTAIISRHLTENIIAPIDQISLSEIDKQAPPYDELQPFVNKIAYQSREITHQMERVKRQKLRLQAVSDSMSEGLIVLDKDGNILSVNNSAMQAFGSSNAEAIKTAGMTALCGNNTDFAANLKKAYSGDRDSFYYTIFGKTFEVFYSPVCDEARVMGVVILMFDMTEKLRNEQIRTEFTANVSHELKTPLTSIHGYAQLMTSGIAKEREDMLTFAEKIEKESRRLIILVEDIMKLSNLDEGVDPEIEGFWVHPMLAEIIEALSMSAVSKNIMFTLEGGDFEIIAGQNQIHELFYNIIDNAIKYNKENGSVKVTVGKSTVTIEDTGIGIPEEYKERIFERFFRVDKSHSKTVNGTGLGLSIVKHIAMNNALSVKVDSIPGKGSIFVIDFKSCLSKNQE